jgi:hypothetical protein
MKDKRKQQELMRQALSNEKLMEEISAELDRLQPGWGRLFRVDKQKLKEQINNKIERARKGEE